jgi:ribbon-helix-helix CopG family protein
MPDRSPQLDPEKPRRQGLRGKRQFLVHLDPDLIRRIKILAIDRNVTASSLVQEALLAYLAEAGGANPLTRRPRPAP